MSDVVKELRERATRVCDNSAIMCEAPMGLLEQAADEIESLRAALEEIDQLATRHTRGGIGSAQRIARQALKFEVGNLRTENEWIDR